MNDLKNLILEEKEYAESIRGEKINFLDTLYIYKNSSIINRLENVRDYFWFNEINIDNNVYEEIKCKLNMYSSIN